MSQENVADRSRGLWSLAQAGHRGGAVDYCRRTGVEVRHFALGGAPNRGRVRTMPCRGIRDSLGAAADDATSFAVDARSSIERRVTSVVVDPRSVGRAGTRESRRTSSVRPRWPRSHRDGDRLVTVQGLQRPARMPSKPPGCRSRRCRRRTWSWLCRVARCLQPAAIVDAFLGAHRPASRSSDFRASVELDGRRRPTGATTRYARAGGRTSLERLRPTVGVEVRGRYETSRDVTVASGARVRGHGGHGMDERPPVGADSVAGHRSGADRKGVRVACPATQRGRGPRSRRVVGSRRCRRRTWRSCARGYSRFRRDGVEGVIPFFTEDAVVYSIPEWPDDPEYYGHDGLREAHPAMDGELRRLLDSIFANSMTEGARWLPSLSSPVRPKAPALPMRMQIGAVFSGFRDGRVAQQRLFSSWDGALAAAGLSE